MNDERFKEDLFRCPYGIDTESELYPSPNTRTLRLRLPDDAHIKLRMMDQELTAATEGSIQDINRNAESVCCASTDVSLNHHPSHAWNSRWLSLVGCR